MRLSLGLFFLLGCSSSSFEVANQTTFDTGGVSSETSTDTGAIVEDTGVVVTDSVVASDGIASETSTGCATPSEVTEVWVDGTSSVKGPNGTADCPFRHINDAVSYINSLTPKARTIRVKAGTYTEGAAIVLRAQVTLRGDGVGVTTLAGGGACMGIGNCIVRLEGGATLDSVSVDAGPTAKHGIVTGGTDMGLPAIKNVRVTGAIGDGNAGILSSSGSVIGPNVDVNGNKLGVVIWGNQKVTISGGNNHFDKNTELGINHEGTGPLVWTGGGTANGNGIYGVKLGEVATPTPPMHTITGATINSNVEGGIRLMANGSLTLRGSTLTGNKIGVFAVLGSTNNVDLGTLGAVGNNKFQTLVGPAAIKNTNAAVCIGGTRVLATGMNGNDWSTCPPSIKSLADIGTTAGCESITAYADVWYRGNSAPDATCPGG